MDSRALEKSQQGRHETLGGRTHRRNEGLRGDERHRRHRPIVRRDRRRIGFAEASDVTEHEVRRDRCEAAEQQSYPSRRQGVCSEADSPY